MPITILTGFLGSGKTTVLNHLTQQPSFERILILINEFGEIGIDSDLVTNVSDDSVIEMSSGCLCCTIRSDITDTLSMALQKFSKNGIPFFKKVIIETTGLADPAPIIHTLMSDPIISTQFDLWGVIATVDAVNGNETIDRQIEAVKQIAMADTILVTKTDLVDQHSLEKLKKRLEIFNPAADQIIVKNGIADFQSLLNQGFYNLKSKSLEAQNWLRAEAYNKDQHHAHTHDDINRHDAEIKAFCLKIDEPILNGALDIWLRALQMFRGDDLLRLKGIINIAGKSEPMIIHGAQHILHPSIFLQKWPSEDRRSRIVFITRNIDPSELFASIQNLTN